MTRPDVLMYSTVGPAVTSLSEPSGGSEMEIVQIAVALTARGHKVVVANGVPEPITVDGVLFVPNDAEHVHKHWPTRALYLERMTPMPSTDGLTPVPRTVVRVTDQAGDWYSAHRDLFVAEGAAVVGVSHWQLEESGADGKGFWARERIMIPPMLGPTPRVPPVPGQFIFASAPIKGLAPTLEIWRMMKRKYAAFRDARLVIVTPGHFDFFADKMPKLTYEDHKEFKISYEGSPTPEAYRAKIAESEALFFCSALTETFGCVAAFAERAGTRTHIFCPEGRRGGLVEALRDHSHLASTMAEFEADVIVSLGGPRILQPVDDRSPATLAVEWEMALRLPTTVGRYVEGDPERMGDGMSRDGYIEALPVGSKDAALYPVVNAAEPSPGYTAVPSNSWPESLTSGSTVSPFVWDSILDEFRARLCNLSAPDAVGDATVTDYWRSRCAAMAQMATTKPVQDFLSWSNDVHHEELPVFNIWYDALLANPDWESRWKRLSRKAPWGNPHPFSRDAGTSPVTLQHAYHLMKYEQAAGQRFVEDLDVIIEVGGGYGNFCRMLRADGFRGTYAIIDLPHAREFQRAYLRLCGDMDVTDEVKLVPGAALLLEKDIPELLKLVAGKRVGFVATWSLSETPMAFRDKLFPALHADTRKYLIASQWPWHHTDGISNEDYFEKLVLDAYKPRARSARIERVMGWGGARYVFIFPFSGQQQVFPARDGKHIGHYENSGTAQRYWVHDRVLVGGSILNAVDAEKLRDLGVTHVLSAENEKDDAGLWPDDARILAPVPRRRTASR